MWHTITRATLIGLSALSLLACQHRAPVAPEQPPDVSVSAAKETVDSGDARTWVSIRVLEDGQGVQGVWLRLGRSVAGRRVQYRWEERTNAGGWAQIPIHPNPDGPFLASGGGGYYVAEAYDKLTNVTIRKWTSIPVRANRVNALLLPLDERASFLSPADTIAIADPAVMQAALEAIGRPTGPLHRREASSITQLVVDQTPVETLEGITNFAGLTYLVVVQAELSDLQPISELTGLTDLELQDNKLTDVSELSPLHSLELLSLSNNLIADILPLAGLHKLDYLGIGENEITDLSPLASLTNLRTLWINDNGITDLSVLRSLGSLELLGFSNNHISDLGPLAPLHSLVAIHAQENAIADLTPIAALPSLEFLDVRENRITDVSPLLDLPALERADLRLNPLDETSITEHIPALEAQGVEVRF